MVVKSVNVMQELRWVEGFETVKIQGCILSSAQGWLAACLKTLYPPQLVPSLYKTMRQQWIIIHPTCFGTSRLLAGDDNYSLAVVIQLAFNRVHQGRGDIRPELIIYLSNAGWAGDIDFS